MTIAEKYDVEEYPTRFSNRAAIQDKTFKDGSPYVSIRLDAGPHEDYITPTAEEAADFRTHLVLEIAVQIYREYVQYPVLVSSRKHIF